MWDDMIIIHMMKQFLNQAILIKDVSQMQLGLYVSVVSICNTSIWDMLKTLASIWEASMWDVTLYLGVRQFAEWKLSNSNYTEHCLCRTDTTSNGHLAEIATELVSLGGNISLYYHLSISPKRSHIFSTSLPIIQEILLFDKQMKENRFSTGSCRIILTPENIDLLFEIRVSTASTWYFFIISIDFRAMSCFYYNHSHGYACSHTDVSTRFRCLDASFRHLFPATCFVDHVRQSVHSAYRTASKYSPTLK